MLFHYSEDPNIQVFNPLKSAANPDMEPAVWAIDHEHAVNYFFPRDCPRVVYSISDKSTQEDIDQFFAHSSAKRIIAVENRWLQRIKETKLYVYTFEEEYFELLDQVAGYYVAYHEVIPIRVEPVGDLIEKVLESGTELRFTPNLYLLRDAIIRSSLNFSIIRYRNAIDE